MSKDIFVLTVGCVLVLAITACNDSSFNSTSPRASSRDQADQDAQANNASITPETSEAVSTDTSVCWVAVTGALDMFNAPFPMTDSSQPIRHGETFAGGLGIFLGPRGAPYEYGTGGGEIDLMVKATPDVIAIAPGMKVKILDGDGRLVLEREGPYIGQSLVLGGAFNAGLTARQRRSFLPEWMRIYGDSKNYTFDVIERLPQGKSFLVTKIPQTICK